MFLVDEVAEGGFGNGLNHAMIKNNQFITIM